MVLDSTLASKPGNGSRAYRYTPSSTRSRRTPRNIPSGSICPELADGDANREAPVETPFRRDSGARRGRLHCVDRAAPAPRVVAPQGAARDHRGGRRKHRRHLGVARSIAERSHEVRPVQNTGEHGFGRAIIRGLDAIRGDAVVIMMADESDDCRDVVRYWQKLNDGWDCVFGSRFMRGGGVIDYPRVKLAINRWRTSSFA
jgi:hypothetical protein